MKVDFHVHTDYSWDASSTPKEVVDAAIEKEIDCICITDHGSIKGAIKAMKYAFDKNLLVIPGIEIYSQSGDILGINVKKLIPGGLSAERTIKEIQKQGGMAIIPHPFNWPIGRYKGGKKELALADGIEVFNSWGFDFANKKAFSFSKIFNLSFTAGSDAHVAKFVGRGYLEIPKENLSEKEVLMEIKNKSAQVKGKILNFWERIENSLKVDLRIVFNRSLELKLIKEKLKKKRKEKN